ncbi:uncharacterized protein GGS25DRAFT_508094 [Hypoxylon fragiforme]|uniref:uncharacterized protein n=1 Tax=Hypoxylon fragiforme TaxID=63214 RepID=UPI0020C5B597|nr:uncharacterized protein GGS25DRAFT_508094 [Hypoxylon fragiforme]KAI2604396.1 hypothetical protein GGS25DRAFT_508094 [Hypoxylon fragiforme]
MVKAVKGRCDRCLSLHLFHFPVINYTARYLIAKSSYNVIYFHQANIFNICSLATVRIIIFPHSTLGNRAIYISDIYIHTYVHTQEQTANNARRGGCAVGAASL